MNRCDVIDLTEGTPERCTRAKPHFGRHAFRAGIDQEICGRTSIRFGAWTIRTCLLSASHPERCVYLPLTERRATQADMQAIGRPEPRYASFQNDEHSDDYPIPYTIEADDPSV
jgi:hypothetical protein